ncbi:MAG: zf-HC2 domain-containing protein, partial [Desulfobulbaceae bacterium]|nr:zf-HC2 domain-containing protein [Desulfobulbaceae bacterium]
MNCTNAQELFSALADGELDPANIARMESHLATCRDCTREWRLFTESLAWLHEVKPVPAPPDLLVGVHAKLDRGNPLLTWLHDLFGSPLRALSSMAVIGLAFFLWVSQPDIARQMPANPFSDSGLFSQSRTPTNPLARFLNPPLEITPAMNSGREPWTNNFAAQPYRLPALPAITPDLAITVHAPSRETRAHLYQRLAAQDRWRIHPGNDGTLLIFLNE